MTVQVRIPAALRSYAEGTGEVEVAAATVGEALERLVTRYPALRAHLFDPTGQLRNFVNAYVNEDDIRSLSGSGTRLGAGDTLTIVPSIAGGTDPVATAPPPASARELSPEEIRRYARHLIMPEVGMQGQQRLKQAKVLMVGAGGLGSPLGLYLAAAGVGSLGIVDFDVVDESNLQRQVMHGTRDVGRRKIESARDRLLDINPHIEVVGYETALSSQNALDILEPWDIIVDGTDNFPTRYLVNDACVLLGKPNVYGSIFRFEGQLSVFWAREGPCYRCLFREPPPPGLVPSCAEGGVLGVLPGIIGTLQALETLKLALRTGDAMIGRLLLFDALAMRFRELKLRKDPACVVCGPEPSVRELIDYDAFCGVPAASQSNDDADAIPVITVTDLKRRLDRGDSVRLIDVREPREWDVANLEEYGAQLIPLRSLPDHLNELESTDEIVLFCRTGARSARALQMLRDAGFRRVWNLEGGLHAWSEHIDPAMPRY